MELIDHFYFHNRPPSIISVVIYITSDVLQLDENVSTSNSGEDIYYESELNVSRFCVKIAVNIL